MKRLQKTDRKLQQLREYRQRILTDGLARLDRFVSNSTDSEDDRIRVEVMLKMFNLRMRRINATIDAYIDADPRVLSLRKA